MAYIQSHSLHDVYELWRRGREISLALARRQHLEHSYLRAWRSDLDRFLEEPELAPTSRGEIMVSLNTSRGGGADLVLLQVATAATSVLRKLLMFPDGARFKSSSVSRTSLVACLQAASDDTEDNPYMGWSVAVATIVQLTGLSIEEVRKAVCWLVEKEMAYFVEGDDDTIVDERFNIEDARAARQLQRWQMEAAVATTVRIDVSLPPELPREWRELVVGIAGKYDFNAQHHLTADKLVVDLHTLMEGDSVREAAQTVAGELERALAAPSRLKPDASSTFINHGQAGAMGPNSTASNNTFQQQVNTRPLESDEQHQLVEQLGHLLDQLRRVAATPEEFTALAEVSRAQLEAKNGNRAGVVGALKRAGKWVQETAENVSAKVITSLIKES